MIKEEKYPEGQHYKQTLSEIIDFAEELMSKINENSELPSWIQDKLTICHHNLDASNDYYDTVSQSVLTEEEKNQKKKNWFIGSLKRYFKDNSLKDVGDAKNKYGSDKVKGFFKYIKKKY